MLTKFGESIKTVEIDMWDKKILRFYTYIALYLGNGVYCYYGWSRWIHMRLSNGYIDDNLEGPLTTPSLHFRTFWAPFPIFGTNKATNLVCSLTVASTLATDDKLPYSGRGRGHVTHFIYHYFTNNGSNSIKQIHSEQKRSKQKE